MVIGKMRILLSFIIATIAICDTSAQTALCLDSCRAMALRNNKMMSVQKVKRDVAHNMTKSARTKYLPRINAIGSYIYNSKRIELLSDDTKQTLNNLGTLTAGMMGPAVNDQMAAMLNGMGGQVVDAFATNTHNIYAGAIMLSQPIFMGGSIMALNKMADINEELADNTAEGVRQNLIYQVDNAYWSLVSLKQKKQLAESYCKLVGKFNDDVSKMIQEGVATRADGLNISVRLNEAEMTLTQVDNGLSLAKMYLCQLCGLDIDENIDVADSIPDINDGSTDNATISNASIEIANAHRPELKALDNACQLAHQATNIAKAGNLPQVMLIGGYTISNPNVYNGFDNKFSGAWSVGVVMRIPVWNWGDVAYKTRAAKGAATIAALELDDAREKVELQLNQSSFKIAEARKRLATAQNNIKLADENLRSANLGYKEGVTDMTTVMEAQTAWLKAHSQMIDAEIDIRLSELGLQKALGTIK